MRAPRVVHVANYDRGMRIHLGNYLCYLRDQGYEVSGVTHPGAWLTHDQTILDGIFIKVLPFMPRLSPWSDLQTLVRLARYFGQEGFDIVHTHTIKPGLLGRLAARATRVPVVVHTIHGWIFADTYSPLKNRLYIWMETLGAACSDRLLSQNREDMQVAIRERICPQGKLAYLGNGIDLARFSPQTITKECLESYRQRLGLRRGEKVVCFAARFEREKGVYEFLEAARRLKRGGVRAKYVMVGARQPQKNSAVSPEVIIHQFELSDDVILLGFHDDMPGLLAAMDVVALPSYREGIPRILMESAAMGVPVVATAVRGTLEAVVDGVTGVLVPPRDPAALAEALRGVLEDPARAAEMGQAARQHALAHFDERSFFWRTDHEYRRLLSEKLGQTIDPLLKPVPDLELDP